MSGRSYQLAGRDSTGVFLGLDAAECLLVATGFAVTIGARLAGVPVLLSGVPLVAATVTAKAAIAGRSVHEWLRLSVAWCVAHVVGRHCWRRPLPLLPTVDGQSPVLPPALDGLDVVVGPDVGGMAVVRDRRRARVTAVLAVRGHRFTGADPGAQDALLAGWGDVLASQATGSTGVVQIGWTHAATPTALDEHRRWSRDRLAGTAVDGAGSAEPYEALIDEVAATASRHDTFVWVTVSGGDIAGRGRPLDRAVAHLPTVVAGVADLLVDAGVLVDAPLTVPELWRLLRRRCDPAHPAGGVDQPPVSLAARMGVVAPTTVGPLAVDVDWARLHVDGSWHRVYWVESWPRRPVPADWLAGFLAGFESTTMTVVHRPVDPARSQRRIDSQLVKLGAHLARKEDRARRVTEVERRVQQAAEDLESEIASGFAETLYLGLVCVSAATAEELDARGHDLEQAARASQLGLRILHGRQDTAWAATLPFGLADPSVLDLVAP